MDYVKSSRHVETFLHAARARHRRRGPHCTDASAGRVSGIPLPVSRLAEHASRPPPRHGNSPLGQGRGLPHLIGFLDPSFRELPDDLSTDERARERRRLARQMVQRRRGDIEHFLGDTPFPSREVSEATYSLTPEYRALFEKVLAYARETPSPAAPAEPTVSVCAGGLCSDFPRAGLQPGGRCLDAPEPRAHREHGDRRRGGRSRTTSSTSSTTNRLRGIDVTPGADAEEERTPSFRTAGG